MYAVIETGGKQYKVAVGDKLRVEKLAADEGASVELGRVLMVADGENIALGSPAAETPVSATVLAHGRRGKIRVFKMKRRKHYRRTQGHRQSYTEIQITAIGDDKAGAKPAKAAKPAKPVNPAKSAESAESAESANPAQTKQPQPAEQASAPDNPPAPRPGGEADGA